MKPATWMFVVLALLLGVERQVMATITLAENFYEVGESAGNNQYSLGTTFGAENFSLSGTFDVTRISHVGHHQTEIAPQITIDWRIYLDDGGVPGEILAFEDAASVTTSLEGSSPPYELTRYTVDISPVTLAAGNYWIGFHNNVSEGDPNWTIASGGTSFDDLSAISVDGGVTWSVPYPGTNMTFRIEGVEPGTVPEPSSLALFSLSIGFAGYLGQRRWNRVATP